MLTAPARRAIINSMSPLSVPAGTAIITQGDAEATRFFVLASGRATVHIADAKTGTRKQVATYNPARFASAAPAGKQCGVPRCYRGGVRALQLAVPFKALIMRVQFRCFGPAVSLLSPSNDSIGVRGRQDDRQQCCE